MFCVAGACGIMRLSPIPLSREHLFISIKNQQNIVFAAVFSFFLVVVVVEWINNFRPNDISSSMRSAIVDQNLCQGVRFGKLVNFQICVAAVYSNEQGRFVFLAIYHRQLKWPKDLLNWNEPFRNDSRTHTRNIQRWLIYGSECRPL